jgi:ABC-type uncharacterized transport system substrate-binding protein
VLLVVLLVGSAAESPAQPPATLPLIGLLSIGTDPAAQLPPHWVAFFEGMRSLGYVEDRTVRIARGFAAGSAERLTQLARTLVEQKAAVIVVTGFREIDAARRATRTIPIVAIVAPDPVANGLATSLAHPGGNLTGLTVAASGVAQKYLELLRAAAPSITRAAMLASRPQHADIQRDLETAARALHVELRPATIVSRVEEIDAFFARTQRESGHGIIVPTDGFTVLHRQRVVDAAARHRVPTIYTTRDFVEAGGLMAYGASFVDLFRRAPVFVDKILKGARPAELPMEQPTRFELVLNARAAKALGLALPASFLARADEVIQ